MTARPFRLRVQDALTARLEQVSRQGPPYTYDLAGAVFRGRVLFGKSDPLPMLAITEPMQPPEDYEVPRDSSAGYVPWDLQIQGFIKDDRAHPTDPAYFLLADVKAALAAEKQRNTRAAGYDVLGMGGRIVDLTIGPGVVRPPDDLVADVAYFWITITLKIVEDHKDPFA
jgi:hypothetical protein